MQVDASTYALSIALKAPSNPVSRKTSSNVASSLAGAGTSGRLSYPNLTTLGGTPTPTPPHQQPHAGGGGAGTLAASRGAYKGSTGSLVSRLSQSGGPAGASPPPPPAGNGGGGGGRAAEPASACAAMGAAAAAVHCADTTDGRVAGAGGSGMAGLGQELARLTSAPDPQHLTVLQEAQKAGLLAAAARGESGP